MLSSDIRSRRMIYRTCRWYKCWYLCHQCFSSWYRTTFYENIIYGKHWSIFMRNIKSLIQKMYITIHINQKITLYWYKSYYSFFSSCFLTQQVCTTGSSFLQRFTTIVWPCCGAKNNSKYCFSIYQKMNSSILKQISNSFQLSWKNDEPSSKTLADRIRPLFCCFCWNSDICRGVRLLPLLS